MNERIKELLSQAGVHYEVMPKDNVYEKFAELIVRECIEILGTCEDYWTHEHKMTALKRELGLEK